jgi:hypothetical protein
MKATFTLCLLLLSLGFLKAQITIGENDFSNAGDTDRVSIANIPTGLNYQATGADTTWDYSLLTWSSQQVDQMLNPINTNTFYALYYADVSFNSNRSNLASTGSLSINISNFLTIGDEYNFFYKYSSAYVQQGIGIEIESIPTEIAYGPRDTIYHFPMQYGNTDGCLSSYKISVPDLGWYVSQQTRTNVVDGWGTLITPFGTFPVLRVVTQLVPTDSFYIDTLHAGINFPLPTINQYKWIGNNEKEPLLQINTQVILGFESITSITYRDSVRNPVVNSINQPANTDVVFNVYPNPASNQFLVSYPNNDGAEMVVTDLDGQELLRKPFAGKLETIDASGWAKGVYLVMLTNEQQTAVKKIVIE